MKDQAKINAFIRAGGLQSQPRLGARCELCGLRNWTVGIWDAEDGILDDPITHNHPKEAIRTCQLQNQWSIEETSSDVYEIIILRYTDGRILCQHCRGDDVLDN